MDIARREAMDREVCLKIMEVAITMEAVIHIEAQLINRIFTRSIVHNLFSDV